MKCINEICGSDLEEGTKFCTSCGTQQSEKQTSQKAASEDKRPSNRTGPTSSGVPTPASTAQATGTLVMRASEHIWDFTETEGKIEPGKPRPIVILDEEYVDLADTTNILTSDQLLERIKGYLDRSQVPVDVSVVKARWQNDKKEVRDRIVASLKDHPFNDIKMIMGLDYMGGWASFKVYLGMQPDTVAKPEEWEIPIDVKIAGIGGALCLVMGLAGAEALLMIGVLALIYAAFRGYSSYKSFKIKTAATSLKDNAKRFLEKFSRTYKTDDMRLFCSSMGIVFKNVIDDIVEKDGARLIKIEGGKGGFFTGSDATPVEPSAKVSDAAELEI